MTSTEKVTPWRVPTSIVLIAAVAMATLRATAAPRTAQTPPRYSRDGGQNTVAGVMEEDATGIGSCTGSPCTDSVAEESHGSTPVRPSGTAGARGDSRSSNSPPNVHAAIVALANRRGLVCTGTVVAKRFVLTARHCLPLVEVRFGADPRAPTEIRRVRRDHVPPLGIDVALIELDEDVTATPIPLRPGDDPAPSGLVRLVGFGAMDSGGARGMSVRHFVDVPARGWGCDPTSSRRAGCNPDYEMVIPRSAGNDTCSGDSGGPVLERATAGLRILAVTSRSVSGALLRCGDGGVYTRADKIGAWISSVTRESRGNR